MAGLSTHTGFSITTPQYAGPFDLVLDLIEERKLLVNELALATITDAFITHVRSQTNFPVEETANFIQIAATLLLIKSKSLIPDLALSSDEEEDIHDLEKRLAAYEKVREASRELSQLIGKRYLFSAGAREPEVSFAPSRDFSAAALETALKRVLAARIVVEQLPEARIKPLISIEEMMERLAKRVEQAMNLSFKEFAGSAKERVEVIVSFLALLELVKQGAVEVLQHEQHGDIRIMHSATTLPHYG